MYWTCPLTLMNPPTVSATRCECTPGSLGSRASAGTLGTVNEAIIKGTLVTVVIPMFMFDSF